MATPCEACKKFISSRYDHGYSWQYDMSRMHDACSRLLVPCEACKETFLVWNDWQDYHAPCLDWLNKNAVASRDKE